MKVITAIVIILMPLWVFNQKKIDHGRVMPIEHLPTTDKSKEIQIDSLDYVIEKKLSLMKEERQLSKIERELEKEFNNRLKQIIKSKNETNKEFQ